MSGLVIHAGLSEANPKSKNLRIPMTEYPPIEILFPEAGEDASEYTERDGGTPEGIAKALQAAGLSDEDAPLQTVTYDRTTTRLPAVFKFLPVGRTINEALYQVSTGSPEDGTNSELGAGPKSVRDVRTGILHHPFDMELATQMRTVNPYHATCIDKLSEVFVGNGFKNKKAAKLLDEVTRHGSIHWAMRMSKMLNATGQMYSEVIRNSSGYIDWIDEILPSKVGAVFPTHRRDLFFYIHQPTTHYRGYGDTRRCYQPKDNELQEVSGFARVGELDFLKAVASRVEKGALTFFPEKMGEIAAYHCPTEQWDFYGCPQWIGAHSYLELSRIHLQRAHDYFFNRGTPDSVTFIYGMNLNKKQLGEFKKAMSAGVGPGHGRSTVLFIPNSSAKTGKVQVERFGDSVDGDTFEKLHNTFALGACAAHGILPILAGISVTRSLGGANEILQALVLLQMTRIHKEQETFRAFMFKNIQPYLKGAPKTDPDFFALEPIVKIEDSDLAAMNSMARQRESSLGPNVSENGLKRD